MAASDHPQVVGRVGSRAHACVWACVVVMVWPALVCAQEKGGSTGEKGGSIKLTLRSRAPIAPNASRLEVVEKAVEWEGAETAVIVCDVWDQHWCKGANERLAAMLPRMNATIKALRAKGALIVHAPSDTMKFYEGTPQRALARNTPTVAPKAVSKTDRPAEPRLPIDDSDGGCDCTPQCSSKGPYPWRRQHAAIEIGGADAISDSGREIYNLFHQRGVQHVIIMGVHTNMCVLGRSFAIRQLVRWGFDVVLMRDLTDTMYNSRRPPVVAHAKGTDLVVEHIETYWCGSASSGDVLGDSSGPRIVFVIAEDEYDAKNTLPAFAKEELEKPLGAQCTFLNGNAKKTNMPGVEAVEEADLLVVYLRRATLPEDQLARLKRYFEAGKPVIALRTACHGFQNWLEFDRVVLGCQYTGHYGNGGATEVRADANAVGEAILRGVSPGRFSSPSWLYMVGPLAKSARPLLIGKCGDQPEEAVAWVNTYRGGRVFFTSLGHRDDFAIPQFRRLLVNAVRWGLDKPIPRDR